MTQTIPCRNENGGTGKNKWSELTELSVKDLLRRQVNVAPDQAALKQEDGTVYTWREIDMASQIIAHDLSLLGVGTGAHVGLCGANSVNWVLTFLALQKLGAVAMLINPAQIAREIGATAVIGDMRFLCYGEIADLDEEDSFLNKLRQVPGWSVKGLYSFRKPQNLKDRFGEYAAIKELYREAGYADAPCAMLFTSGSTGRPKGVIHSSRSLLKASEKQVVCQYVTEQDRNLLIVPLFHIMGLVVCLFPCMLTGALLIIPDNIRTATLIRIMREEKCTLLHSVPTMFIALLNNRCFDPADFTSLRCTFLAGAAATEKQMDNFIKALPQNHFVVAYGLSEIAPVSVTIYGESRENLLHTVGVPLYDTEVKIIDRETGKLCPPGNPGEILTRGEHLMLGFYNVSLADYSMDADGFLHTGDIGCFREDGYLCFEGRYKDLIIRGGENIMPQEVEAAVAELEEIEDVRVIGYPSDFFGEEVGACVKIKQGMCFREEDAKARLAARLSKYKIPSRFLAFQEFPLLGSGKIDMMKLKDIFEHHIQEEG